MAKSLTLEQKARDMRNAIDMIEGAMMGAGDFVDLPALFATADETVVLAPKMTVGEMRRVCNALAECTRIVNSDEYSLRGHAVAQTQLNSKEKHIVQAGWTIANSLAVSEHEQQRQLGTIIRGICAVIIKHFKFDPNT